MKIFSVFKKAPPPKPELIYISITKDQCEKIFNKAFTEGVIFGMNTNYKSETFENVFNEIVK